MSPFLSIHLHTGRHVTILKNKNKRGSYSNLYLHHSRNASRYMVKHCLMCCIITRDICLSPITRIRWPSWHSENNPLTRSVRLQQFEYIHVIHNEYVGLHLMQALDACVCMYEYLAEIVSAVVKDACIMLKLYKKYYNYK